MLVKFIYVINQYWRHFFPLLVVAVTLWQRNGSHGFATRRPSREPLRCGGHGEVSFF